MFVPRIVSVPIKKANRPSRSLSIAEAKDDGTPKPKNDNQGAVSPNKCFAASTRKEDVQEGKMDAFGDGKCDYTAAGTQDASRSCGEFDSIEKNADGDVADDNDEIVEWSKNQRWPKAGEPICIICGRYGAYICDRTDFDVCSIECKKKNLERDIQKRIPVNLSKDAHVAKSQPISAVSSCEGECKFIDCVNLKNSEYVENVDPEAFSSYFNRNYTYNYHPTVKKLNDENIKLLREKLEIRVQGENVAPLGLEFDHFLFPSKLEDNLYKNNYIIPTPIQMQAIPVALGKRDLLACAQTGTGKSASFLLPIITKIFSLTELLPPSHQFCCVPLALILGPTRELCMQIEEQAKCFCKGLSNMKTALLVGGNPLPQQLHRMEQGVQILIATPGRLNDILKNHNDKCDLRFVQMFVLDEVDTMLQLGFQAQVDQIIQSIPKYSQKLMFSATIPASIEKMATEILQDPNFVSVGQPSMPNKSVKQIIIWVEEKSKKKRLFDLVTDKKHFIPPIVIFVDSKIGADMLADALNKACGISCASLHGDKPQHMRTQILQDFQNGSYEALVSTSVLGRGIDLLNVLMVVNFDMPPTVNEYIHQVGRAGKLNKNGFAISFINNSNKDIFLSLFELFRDSGVKLPAELMNSPYLQQQQEKRQKKSSKRRNDVVTTGNLMDLLKEYKNKRRK